MLAALTSALAQTLMNISVKEVRNRKGYNGAVMLAAMTTVSTLTLTPFIFSSLGFSSTYKASVVDMLISAVSDVQVGRWWPIFLISSSSIAFHVEYVLNMIYVGYVNSLTFSVSDVARRLAIIIFGAIVFGKTLTILNCLGIALALIGVLSYSYIDNSKKDKQT